MHSDGPTLGLIGCGNMGGGMGATLLRAGYDLLCFDPATQMCEKMRALGARISADPQKLAAQVNILILSLPKAQVVEAVMAQIRADLTPGTIILDTSTSEPATSQTLAAQGASDGFSFVDGPVSGGPTAAHAGTMTMLLGGDPAAIEALRPIVSVLTAKTLNVGGAGAGHAAKIANNMLCAANLVLVAEAVRLGQAAGVAPADLLEGINAGSGRSGVSEVNFPKWILNDAFDSGFTMGLMRKDVGLALDLAETQGVDLPGFSGIGALWCTGSSEIADAADFNEITKLRGADV